VSPVCVFGTIGKLFIKKGALTLLHGVPTHGKEDVEF